MSLTSVLRLLVISFILVAASCTVKNTEHNLTEFSWDALVAQARGSSVNWAMWGGDERINSWVDTVVTPELKKRFDIKLTRIPMDASVFISKLSNEKKAGKQNGSLDLVWINGENFRRAREEGLLRKLEFGPNKVSVPNLSYVDPRDYQSDFGTPIEGFELPYGRAQFVFEYDTARIANPPKNFAELKSWILANPGRFTYPLASDFTGSAFIRQVLYETCPSYTKYLTPFDAQQFDKDTEPLWKWFKDIQPYLWQKGKTYPADKAKLDLLFERGELDFNMSYSQGGAQGLILSGRYPPTVRTFVMEGNSLGNIHFTAIPFNAKNPAAAMVLANFLLEPELQASKNDPANWGDFTVLDLERLNPEDKQYFEQLDLGPATLPLEELGRNMVPEVSSMYVEALEILWEDRILTMQ